MDKIGLFCNNSKMGNEQSFTGTLVKKLSWLKQTGVETGKNTSAAQNDVKRQLTQVAYGNPITGEGVTKSGPED
ncbi:MAG: hypothetical protein M1308_22110 [Actinobacteria bacterium]|nr:hypothetical protein [Actinomycetota bacterium]